MATRYVKFLRGTPAAYNKLANKDADTLYFITEADGSDGVLYLGTKKIAGAKDFANSSIGELKDVFLTNEIEDKSVLVYDSVEGRWENRTFDEIFPIFDGATDLLPGLPGLVPAPQANQHGHFLRGDGTWAELEVTGSNTQVFEITLSDGQTDEEALTAATTGIVLAKGDIAIIKKFIATATEGGVSEDKYSYTSYVYTGAHWAAMDGNYNAENVYFDEDMMVTKEIGYITLSKGQGTIPSKGKNLMGVFEAMFVKEQNPTKTDPSVSVTLTKAGSYEVGTIVTGIKYTASYEDGSYSYGPEPTGAQITKWEITSTNGHSSTITPGEGETTVASSVSNIDLDSVVVSDTTNLTVTAKATHTAGVTPKTNKGNDCTDSSKKISAGTKSKTSSAVTGYRSFFYGAITVPMASLTSEIIRSLTNAGAYNEAKSFTIKADGATNLTAFIVAIPANNTRSGITKVNSTAGMTVDMTESYTQRDNVSVADCRGTIEGTDQNPTAYKIFAWTPASIDSGAVHEFTLG